MRHPNWSLIFLGEKTNSEIVEDCIEESYNNNGKPWKSSTGLRVKRNFFIFFIFLHFPSCFIIFLHSSSFFIFHFSFSFIFPFCVFFFLFLFSFSFSFKCMRLQAQVSEFNERCFHRSRCSTEMWCPDDRRRDGWDWGKRPFNSQCGVEAPRQLKTKPPRDCIVVVIVGVVAVVVGVVVVC